jgi:enoyl-[acyl-carrier protein] reductase I
MTSYPRSAGLDGKRGLIVGIANEASIAWGCAAAMHAAGARLAVTYLNAKAEPHVRPLAERLGAELVLPCDVEKTGETEAVFDAAASLWGTLDFVVHSIAFAPKDDLHGRVTDCSREGFLRAIDISCHSFIRMAKLAEPLMPQGGTLLTMSYLGAEEVIPNYNMMGPVKAALEAASRYLAAELGPKGIRVHAISPGPLKTRAASGLSGFDELMDNALQRAPLRHLVSIEDVGALAAFIASDAARSITGGTLHVDAGYHILN